MSDGNKGKRNHVFMISVNKSGIFVMIPQIIKEPEYAWKSDQKENGAQIDLIIDRRDDVMNICEMKCDKNEYIRI